MLLAVSMASVQYAESAWQLLLAGTAFIVFYPIVKPALILWQSQWVSPDPQVEPYDAWSYETPKAALESIWNDESTIETIGFQSLGRFRLSHYVSGAETFVTLFEN